MELCLWWMFCWITAAMHFANANSLTLAQNWGDFSRHMKPPVLPQFPVGPAATPKPTNWPFSMLPVATQKPPYVPLPPHGYPPKPPGVGLPMPPYGYPKKPPYVPLPPYGYPQKPPYLPPPPYGYPQKPPYVPLPPYGYPQKPPYVPPLYGYPPKPPGVGLPLPPYGQPQKPQPPIYFPKFPYPPISPPIYPPMYPPVYSPFHPFYSKPKLPWPVSPYSLFYPPTKPPTTTPRPVLYPPFKIPVKTYQHGLAPNAPPRPNDLIQGPNLLQKLDMSTFRLRM